MREIRNEIKIASLECTSTNEQNNQTHNTKPPNKIEDEDWNPPSSTTEETNNHTEEHTYPNSFIAYVSIGKHTTHNKIKPTWINLRKIKM